MLQNHLLLATVRHYNYHYMVNILKCKMGGTDRVPIARLAVDNAILVNRK